MRFCFRLRMQFKKAALNRYVSVLKNTCKSLGRSGTVTL
ncbi:protein of unknown function [Burkholderia multivorans]